MTSMGFRRRNESVTNYRKRLALVKSRLDRVVVRKTNRKIIGEIIRYDAKGDVVLAYADSSELMKMNWPSRSNKPTAYLTGLLLAKKAKSSGEDCILDIGLSSSVKESIPFVFAKGCVDGGMKLRSNIEIDEKSYNHTGHGSYAEKLKKEKPEAYNKQYGAYIKSKVDVVSLNSLFNQVKSMILKE